MYSQGRRSFAARQLRSRTGGRVTRGKYTVTEVEERTGVPASTLRQWERRYGFPKPERSESGYRLYSEQDLVFILAMKEHIAEGIPASRAAQLVRRNAPFTGRRRTPADLRDDLIEAMSRLDGGPSNLVRSEAFRLHSVDLVVVQVLVGAVSRLGEMWERGEVEATVVSAAATYACGKLLALLEGSVTPGKPGGSVAIACAPDERHELGALVFTLLLRRAGFSSYYLSTAASVADLVVLTRRLAPGVLVLCATTTEVLEALLEKRRPLLSLPSALMCAGPAFRRREWAVRELGGEYLGDTIQSGLVTMRDRIGAMANGVR